MKLIHRYLLRELLLNAVVSLITVFSIFFLGAVSLQVDKANYENMPMIAVLRYVSLLLAYTSYLTLPLTVLTTCIFTYGRASQDGEIAAATTGGVHPWQPLVPGVLVGAVVGLLLAACQDRLMPEAHYLSRRVDESVLSNAAQLLKRNDRQINFGNFIFTWRSVASDRDGNMILREIEYVQYRKGKPISWTRASHARPVVDPDSPRMVLELEEVTRHENGHFSSVDRLAVPVDLRILAATPPRRAVEDLSYENLLTDAHLTDRANRRHRALAEYNFRLAMSISPLLFGLLGAPLGVTLRLRNRALVFLTGLLIVALCYWPLLAMFKNFAEKGAIPAWISLQIPNILLTIVAASVLRKAFRT